MPKLCNHAERVDLRLELPQGCCVNCGMTPSEIIAQLQDRLGDYQEALRDKSSGEAQARGAVVALRKALQELHDRVDRFNNQADALVDAKLCFFCGSKDYDGDKVVHFKKCPLQQARAVLSHDDLGRKMSEFWEAGNRVIWTLIDIRRIVHNGRLQAAINDYLRTADPFKTYEETGGTDGAH